MKEFHILNGDALKDQFPDSLNGELIVARECLVNGDVSADSLDQLFELRAEYLSNAYDSEKGFYHNEVIPEFKKIISLPEHSVINLWFEDDLFCQVNLWFVSHLILNFVTPTQVFLVRPHTDIQYGFGGLNSDGLENAFRSKVRLSVDEVKLFSSLWELYQDQNHTEILELAVKHSKEFPFLEDAAQANLERFPSDGSPGRPEQTLLDIMKETGSDEFGLVFREFHKRESIYGFGDLQVKRLFDQLRNS
ncbi:DUF1835 domain-containing protein [Balneola sp. EhC07]|jgi:hypothetical protein|uniref:DUF1835 domain-containing protein n=1 Tax=Balneola sp. EhC07 TaxID=1849360 RepID=UPI0007F340EC|nr:DUF1835 domain-containing protein [Balneola sp. EhC07]OAN62871.1 DUF1835 domain-containing protein [Balneola sp. EhC07]